MNDPKRNRPGQGGGSEVNGRPTETQSIAAPRPAHVSCISIADLAVVFGQSYPDGPFGCIYCRRRSSILTAFVVTPTTSRCGQCGRETTFARLRRAATEDPVTARRLRELLGVADRRDVA